MDKWTMVCGRSNISALLLKAMIEKTQVRQTFSHLLIFALLLSLCSGSLISTKPQSFAIDLQGKPFDPFRATPKKVIVLLFVRTDCPISNRYAPTIQHLSAQYRG